MEEHVPVLREEVLEQLAIRPDGCYVDGTFGRGGHSRAILQRLGPAGRLLAMDRDPAAVVAGEALAARDSRFVMGHGRFSELKAFVTQRGAAGKLDGILLDLGVSSPQLDDAQRGFSFSHDGPLDMRMDPRTGPSAADWLNAADETEIARVLRHLGEERLARRLARAICAQRAVQPITTTRQLVAIIEQVSPRRPGQKHPATKTFQAIRIHINQELQELERVLPDTLDLLASGGRLCVISFHSLEDRLIKRFLRDNARVDPALSQLPVVPSAAQPTLRLPGGAIRPGAAEVDANPRSRSATLRVGEKL